MAKTYVGHYGCAAANRLVKVGTRRAAKPKYNEKSTVERCPGCGHEHLGISPMWRRPRRGEFARVEVHVRR